MEISRTDQRHFNASQQEQIEAALDTTGAGYELDGNATAYEVRVSTQDQLRAVLTAVESQFSHTLTVSI